MNDIDQKKDEFWIKDENFKEVVSEARNKDGKLIGVSVVFERGRIPLTAQELIGTLREKVY